MVCWNLGLPIRLKSYNFNCVIRDKYIETAIIDEVIILPTIVRVASTILSSKGYVAQNIAAYKANCIADQEITGSPNNFKLSTLDSVIDIRATEKQNLQSSMDKIISTELKNFSPPSLVSEK